MKNFFACLLLALLSACGFHLQGRTALPAALRIVLLEADDPQTDFAFSLQQSLQASGTTVTTAAKAGATVIRIERDQLIERVLAVSSRNIPREYELTYHVRLSVRQGDKELLAGRDYELSRDFSFDERAVLAKEREKELLRRALAQDLAATVLRQLSSL